MLTVFPSIFSCNLDRLPSWLIFSLWCDHNFNRPPECFCIAEAACSLRVFLSCWTLREFTSRQVLTGFTVTQTSVSNHHHNTTMTHSAVNQPTRCPCSHFGDLGCWEGEDGTCDLGLTAMTAGISKKPQPVLLCVCVSVNNVWAYILSTLYLQTN